MTDEAQRWKEKYLKSIEQQEKLERRWDARLDLLRRGLVRSTLAAEGSDRVVDECMKEMRDVIRTDNMDAALAGLIPRLEKAVLDSEQRRATRVAQVGSALGALVGQLQALPLDSDVRRPLKKLAKQVEARASQSREVPLLLSELSKLQGQALEQLTHPQDHEKQGFLQRLFGGRDAHSEPVPEQPASQPAADTPARSEEPAAPVMPSAPTAPAAAQMPPGDVDELRPLSVAAEAPVEVPAPPAAAPASEDAAQAQPEAESSAESPAPAADEAEPEQPAVEADETPATTVETAETADATESAEPSDEPEVELTPEQIFYSLPDGTEPTYSSVATHIFSTE